MIVKIAKKLGFDGFKDFRAGLVDYNRLPTADLHQELAPDDSDAEIARKVFRTSIQALEETLSILDPRAFERAADMISTPASAISTASAVPPRSRATWRTNSCASACGPASSTTRT